MGGIAGCGGLAQPHPQATTLTKLKAASTRLSRSQAGASNKPSSSARIAPPGPRFRANPPGDGGPRRPIAIQSTQRCRCRWPFARQSRPIPSWQSSFALRRSRCRHQSGFFTGGARCYNWGHCEHGAVPGSVHMGNIGLLVTDNHSGHDFGHRRDLSRIPATQLSDFQRDQSVQHGCELQSHDASRCDGKRLFDDYRRCLRGRRSV